MRFYKISSDRDRVYTELLRIGVDPYAMQMADKGEQLNVVITDVKHSQANLIKQESLASGMDTAVKRGVITASVDLSDIMIMGDLNDYDRLLKRLKLQKPILKEIPEILEKFINSERTNYFITRGEKVSLDTPLLMGIMNCTPDSFSDRDRFLTEDEQSIRIKTMIEEGADIVDIGGASSRPNADEITSDEEISRISTAVKISSESNLFMSIDTNNYLTAKYAITHGAKIINDINGLEDDNMARLVADSKVAVVIMHKRGNSKEMIDMTNYQNLIHDIKVYFSERIEKALKFGVDMKSIILDVGFGFSKTYEQNLQLLRYLKEFKSFGLPILSGLSNKSTIGVATGRDINQRAYGSVSADTIALLGGTDIVRSHNIRATRDAIMFTKAVIDI